MGRGHNEISAFCVHVEVGYWDFLVGWLLLI